MLDGDGEPTVKIEVKLPSSVPRWEQRWIRRQLPVLAHAVLQLWAAGGRGREHELIPLVVPTPGLRLRDVGRAAADARRRRRQASVPLAQHSPTAWADLHNKTEPPGPGRTWWFPATLTPARVGTYERRLLTSVRRHFWDGDRWLSKEGGRPIKPSVEVSWPCWRGTTAPVREA